MLWIIRLFEIDLECVDERDARAGGTRSQACFSFNEADNNVMTLLEIALQLLPEEEMEVLDDLHKIYLEV